MPSSVFLSYARENGEFALRLGRDLAAARIDVWIDQLALGPGELWDQAVQEALQGCSTVVVVLSPEAVSSRSVMDEVAFALDRGKRIVPVIFRPVPLPLRLSRVHYVDFDSPYPSALAQLTKLLAAEHPEHPDTGGMVGPGPAPEPARPPLWRRQWVQLTAVGAASTLATLYAIKPWRSDEAPSRRGPVAPAAVISELELRPDTLTLLVGDTATLAIRALPSGIAPTRVSVDWRSSAERVATVRQGTIVAWTAGTSGITATRDRVAATSAVIVREATGSIEGHVRDRNSAPLAQVRVSVSQPNLSATTNQRGYYLIRGVRPGSVSVRAAAPGFNRATMILVPVIGGDTTPADLRLERSSFPVAINLGSQWRYGANGRVEGHVRDEQGAPVAAEVRIVGTSLRAVADPQGHYIIRAVPTVAVVVQARSAGHATAERRDVAIVNARVSTVDLTLRRRG